MITEDYVSFETAKLLKEKGFRENTNRYYNAQYGQIRTVSDIFMTDWNDDDYMKRILMDGAVAIPTIQMAMKWIQDAHNIVVVPNYEYEFDNTPWCYKIFKLEENGKPEVVAVKGVSYDKDGNPTEHIVGLRDYERSDSDYITREEACEAAIKYCLENLI